MAEEYQREFGLASAPDPVTYSAAEACKPSRESDVKVLTVSARAF